MLGAHTGGNWMRVTHEILSLIAAAVVLGTSSFVFAGGIRYVDDDAVPGGDGAAWETAYRFLRDAVNEAAIDTTINEIRVAEGTYRPPQDDANPDGPMASDCCEIHGDPGCDNADCEAAICAVLPSCCDTTWDITCATLVNFLCDPGICIPPDLRLMSFDLVNGVALRGGYAGQGAPDPDTRDIDLHETILTGDLLGNDGPAFANNEENSYHVVTGDDTDGTPELDGFTITAGNANGDEEELDGGGFHMIDGNATIRDCHFLRNFAGLQGAGAHCTVGSTVSFVRCVFEANAAEDAGGLASNDDTTLTDCTFLNNYADAIGGGALVGGTIATLTGCRFEGNTARIQAGGFRAVADTLVMIGCDFISNTALEAPFSSGGGAKLSGLPMTVRDCTFIDNHTIERGGAIEIAGVGIIENCTFEGNTAVESGGAIAFPGPTEAFPIVGCTFIGNQTVEDHGGAIYSGLGTGSFHLFVRDSTFSGNISHAHGGAIYTVGNSATIEDCLFDSNHAGGSGGAYRFESPNEDDTIDVLRCTFMGNTTEQMGGGMSLGTAKATIADCSFILNSAQTTAGGLGIGLLETTVSRCLFVGNSALEHGGGASAYGNDPGGLFDRCVFVGNSATRGGGLHAQANIGDDPLLTIAGCQFLGNQSESDEPHGLGRGGGVYLNNIDTVLVNSTLSGNTADDIGGGLFIRGGSNNPNQGDVVHIINCTLSQNTALVGTGGAWDENHEDGTTFNNCILWGNVDSTGTTRAAQIDTGLEFTQPLVNYSCIQGWDGAFDGVGNIDDDPLLVDPDGADDDVGTDDDNLRLLSGSPCIDAGDNTAVPVGVLRDLEGNPRFLDSTLLGTMATVDMGAYEFRRPPGGARVIGDGPWLRDVLTLLGWSAPLDL